ncbi:MAG: MFS transporter [Actinobacteria bacterium]|jgi:UMF1 family MFS transporter|nr:MFS transporter [Actinomycetota bacterium]PLS87351.1 MAG: MFS transporter [Actinomycetota bacterium]
MKGDGTSGGSGGRASGLSVWSWVIYDFSNTIFSISILSYFFPLWFGGEMGAGGNVYNYLAAFSAFMVVLTAPVLGAVADLKQRRRPYLVIFTLLAVAFTAGLGLVGSISGAAAMLVVAAVFFVAAQVAYQSALVFYYALLPGVAAGRGTGRISGYGTGVGYAGAIVALLALTFFVSEQSLFGLTFGGPEAARSTLGPLGGWIDVSGETSSNAFLPTAALFLIFSLPAFFFVPDRVVREPRPVRLAEVYRGVFSTARSMRAYAGLGVFMISTLLYTDAANAAINNMGLYGREVFEMDGSQTRNLLLFSTVFAGVGSVAFGLASDRVGPKKTLVSVLLLWLVSISLAVVATAPWMLFMAGPLVGSALGGTWTVSRAMLLALSPPERVGEFFGIYVLTDKLSAVLGPVVIASVLTALEGYGTLSYRVAIGSLIPIMALGLFLLLRVPDVRPDPKLDATAPEAAAEGTAGPTR